MSPLRTKLSQSFNSFFTQKPFKPFAIIKTINFKKNSDCFTETSEGNEESAERMTKLPPSTGTFCKPYPAHISTQKPAALRLSS